MDDLNLSIYFPIPTTMPLSSEMNTKRKRLNRVPWNREDVYDIWFLVHNTAGFITQLQKLRSMSMCEPFEVKIEGMPVPQKKEMEYLQKTFWLKSVYDIFVWKLCYGIVPYFEKTIQDTAHRIPVVPEITQGTLYVYEDDDRLKVRHTDTCAERMCLCGSLEVYFVSKNYSLTLAIF